MNTATRLLARLGGLQAEANDADATATTASHGAGAEFAGEEHTQSQGLLDQQRLDAKAQEEAQDDTGSVDGDLTAPELDVKADDEQTDTDTEKASDDDAGEASPYMYGGHEVTVTNKPEMVDAFTEKGLDIDAVNGELFSEAGLTDETREKLNEAFGKTSVDMYLEGWQKSNDAMVAEHTANETALDAATDAVVKEVVGDKMDAVMSWANDNLTNAEYTKYQTAINSGDDFTMKLALQSLAEQSGILGAKPAPISGVRETALTATNVQVDLSDTMLSEMEYKALFVPVNGKTPYWDNPSKYDGMRNAGRLAGI